MGEDYTRGVREEWIGSLGLADACKLLYVQWINNQDLLYSTGNNTQYPVISHGKVCVCVYIYIYIYMVCVCVYIYIFISQFSRSVVSVSL